MNQDLFQSCIDSCNTSALTCEQCATECADEKDAAMMVRCIDLDEKCALVCKAAADLMSRGGEHVELLCSACAEICNACADECEKHEFDHCKRCAEACRACAEECLKMAGHHA
jgi:hypothetical protein